MHEYSASEGDILHGSAKCLIVIMYSIKDIDEK